MAKSFVSQVKSILGHHADTVSKKKDGSIIIRRGFYYRHGMDAEGFKLAICKVLARNDLQFHIKDYGEHYTSFRGGASIAQSSHWFVEIWPPAGATTSVTGF